MLLEPAAHGVIDVAALADSGDVALHVDGLRSQALGKAKFECATAFNAARTAACVGWKADGAHGKQKLKIDS